MKNQKGITLVALVVTVIVLLILAAVSLNLVSGSDGIISKAANAVDKTQIESAKEQVELQIAEWVADYYEEKFVTETLAYQSETPQHYIYRKFRDPLDATKKVTVNVGNYRIEERAEDNQIVVNGPGLFIDSLTVDVSEKGALIHWSL